MFNNETQNKQGIRIVNDTKMCQSNFCDPNENKCITGCLNCYSFMYPCLNCIHRPNLNPIEMSWDEYNKVIDLKIFDRVYGEKISTYDRYLKLQKIINLEKNLL